AQGPDGPAARPPPPDRLQVVPERGAARAAPAEPALPAPPEPRLPSPPVPPAAAASDPDSCAKFDKEISAWLEARRKVPRLEAQIERIESNPVEATTSEICPRYS